MHGLAQREMRLDIDLDKLVHDEEQEDDAHSPIYLFLLSVHSQ